MARWINGKQQTPPPELEIGWNMVKFKALPYSGGVLDQPYTLMLKIRSALNFEAVYTNYKRLDAKSLYKWASENQDLLALVTNVEKEM